MWHHLLREDSVFLHLEAPGAEAALAEMVALLRAPEIHFKQKSGLLEFLLQRESLGTTAVGDGIALPHCIFPEVNAPFGCLGISRKGVPFPSLDGAPVFLILMTVFPEHGSGHAERFKILREAELFLKDPFARERLKISESPEEAYEMIVRESAYLASSSKAFGLAGNQ